MSLMTTKLGVAELEASAAGLEGLHARIAPRFAHSEPRERVLAYVRWLWRHRWRERTPGRHHRGNDGLHTESPRLADWKTLPLFCPTSQVRDSVADICREGE